MRMMLNTTKKIHVGSVMGRLWGIGKGEPTPNRVQSSLLELPRCEGGKDHGVGLKEKGERRNALRGGGRVGNSRKT
jgi:hypothetical protein